MGYYFFYDSRNRRNKETSASPSSGGHEGRRLTAPPEPFIRDGEVVSYKYDRGGALFSVEGQKGTEHFTYLAKAYYNLHGARITADLGNGTRTEYRYDALQRLDSLTTLAADGSPLQRLKYRYDGVGNITKIRNSANAVGGLGGGYTNYYFYDALNRLVEANQNYGSGNALNMSYSAAGRLSRKEQTFTGQMLHYGYCDDKQPHAPRRVWNEATDRLHDLQWDANGNLVQVNDYRELSHYKSSRYLYWDERNQMTNAVDRDHFSYYGYDGAGERTLKITGYNNVMDINNERMQCHATLGNITLYTSPYLVASTRGYSNSSANPSSEGLEGRRLTAPPEPFVYAGAERICAKLGGGGLDANSGTCIEGDGDGTAGGNVELSRKARNLFETCRNRM